MEWFVFVVALCPLPLSDVSTAAHSLAHLWRAQMCGFAIYLSVVLLTLGSFYADFSGGEDTSAYTALTVFCFLDLVPVVGIAVLLFLWRATLSAVAYGIVWGAPSSLSVCFSPWRSSPGASCRRLIVVLRGGWFQLRLGW